MPIHRKRLSIPQWPDSVSRKNDKRTAAFAFFDPNKTVSKPVHLSVEQTPKRSRVPDADAGYLDCALAEVGRKERKGLPGIFGFVGFSCPTFHRALPKITGVACQAATGDRSGISASMRLIGRVGICATSFANRRRVSCTGAKFREFSSRNMAHKAGSTAGKDTLFFPTTVGRLPAKRKPLHFAITAHSNSSLQTRNNRRADKAFERLAFLRPLIHEIPRTDSGRGHYVTAEDIPQNPVVRGPADRTPLARSAWLHRLSGDPADADGSQDARTIARELSRKIGNGPDERSHRG